MAEENRIEKMRQMLGKAIDKLKSPSTKAGQDEKEQLDPKRIDIAQKQVNGLAKEIFDSFWVLQKRGGGTRLEVYQKEIKEDFIDRIQESSREYAISMLLENKGVSDVENALRQRFGKVIKKYEALLGKKPFVAREREKRTQTIEAAVMAKTDVVFEDYWEENYGQENRHLKEFIKGPVVERAEAAKRRIAKELQRNLTYQQVEDIVRECIQIAVAEYQAINADYIRKSIKKSPEQISAQIKKALAEDFRVDS